MICTRDEVLIDAVNLSQSFGSLRVFENLSLQIHNLHVTGRIAGQVVALLGPSGCGKTVLMKILAGLLKPTAGEVLLGTKSMAVHRGMCGFVFQGYPLFRHLRVHRNLTLAAELAGIRDAEGAAHRYLEMFRLDQHASKFPAELSGGMRQRIAIAQQLVSMDGPRAPGLRIMMLDEPFSALDYANTKRTVELLRTVADLDDTNTLVVTSHDIRAAISLADIVMVMGVGPNGGYFRKAFDLVSEGLTWSPDVERLPRFAEIEAEIRSML